MSYTQIYYHIVFSTKDRLPVLRKEHRKDIYNYLWGVLKSKRCHLYRMGGVEDHIHIFTSIHVTINLADLVRDLKTSSSTWIKKERIISKFPGWQTEYSAFTKSHSHRNKVINYIKNQEEHHKSKSFIDELKYMLKLEGVAFKEKYIQ